MTKVTIVSMVSGIITRGVSRTPRQSKSVEVSRNDVLRGLYLKKRERAKKRCSGTMTIFVCHSPLSWVTVVS